MLLDTKNMFSISEANKNFSQVTKKASQVGEVAILKYNKPKYLLIDISKYDDSFMEIFENLKSTYIRERIKKNYSRAFKELAK